MNVRLMSFLLVFACGPKHDADVTDCDEGYEYDDRGNCALSPASDSGDGAPSDADADTDADGDTDTGTYRFLVQARDGCSY